MVTQCPPRGRRLAKSTLLLIPLFGIHYTVFAVLPIGVSSKYRILFELCGGSFQVCVGGAGRPPRGEWPLMVSDDPFSPAGPGGGSSLLLSEQ